MELDFYLLSCQEAAPVKERRAPIGARGETIHFNENDPHLI